MPKTVGGKRNSKNRAIAILKASNRATLERLKEAEELLLEAHSSCYMGAGSDGKSIWLIPHDYMRTKITNFLNK